MKGSDKIKMTVNIAGELIKLDVRFDDQNSVRDAEREVKLYIDSLKKKWPEISDRKLLAMALYQYAHWNLKLLEIQDQVLDITDNKCKQIDKAVTQQDD
ncbi:MAG: cell division protein ZapA [Muribaculaceae bacterium]|nr:cell division protein ZapA [Muribaculaceae bacterium]